MGHLSHLCIRFLNIDIPRCSTATRQIQQYKIPPTKGSKMAKTLESICQLPTTPRWLRNIKPKLVTPKENSCNRLLLRGKIPLANCFPDKHGIYGTISGSYFGASRIKVHYNPKVSSFHLHHKTGSVKEIFSPTFAMHRTTAWQINTTRENIIAICKL